jgi:hypothetical protein
MRQADIERGRTYINWPETATRTVTSIRGGIARLATAKGKVPFRAVRRLG